MNPTLFSRGANPVGRLIVFIALSLALMYFDHQSEWTSMIRAYVSNTIYPVRLIADSPSRGYDWAKHSFFSRSNMAEELQQLRAENRLLGVQVRQLQALKFENDKLLGLLNSSTRLPNQFATARMLAVRMDPHQQRVVINRGNQDGLESGLPIMDNNGVLGRLTDVHAFHSEAMLISDPDHAIPVRLLRNGVRTIAIGLGRTDRLQLLYLPVNTDIETGDELVTSGLGGKFPPDFPVAVVKEISRNTNSPFAEIFAEPMGSLQTSRDILIVRPDLSTPEEKPSRPDEQN